MMLSPGFEVGQGSPCNFKHVQRQVSVTVHGDDFTSTGTEANLKRFEEGLARAFETKAKILGPEKRHLQEVRILNRVLSWTATSITYEADPHHAEIIRRDLGLETCRPVTTPGEREDVAKASSVVVSSGGELTNEGEGEPLASPEATRFRPLTARANYLAQDRSDIYFFLSRSQRGGWQR